MLDIVEIQQFISNIPSVEKVAASSQVLAVNSANMNQKDMEIADEVNLSTVVESDEVLEAVNDKDNKKSGGEEKRDSEDKEKEEDGGQKEAAPEVSFPHIDLTV